MLHLQAARLEQDTEAMFRYARQMDKKVLDVQGEEGLMLGFGDVITNVIKIYTKATRMGAQHLHHCLPRIISIWLDFSATLHNAKTRKDKDMKLCATIDSDIKSLGRVADLLREWGRVIPSFYLLTAAPQLVSRICHPVEETWVMLRTMIARLLVSHPQQAFWHLVAVGKVEILNGKTGVPKFLNWHEDNSLTWVHSLTSQLHCVLKLTNCVSYQWRKQPRSFH